MNICWKLLPAIPASFDALLLVLDCHEVNLVCMNLCHNYSQKFTLGYWPNNNTGNKMRVSSHKLLFHISWHDSVSRTSDDSIYPKYRYIIFDIDISHLILEKI